jgi:hypothetical protein
MGMDGIAENSGGNCLRGATICWAVNANHDGDGLMDGIAENSGRNYLRGATICNSFWFRGIG